MLHIGVAPSYHCATAQRHSIAVRSCVMRATLANQSGDMMPCVLTGSSTRATGAKGAAAAALEAQQAAAAAAAAAAEAAAVLQPGQLRVQMCVSADVATRDWLRAGFEVKLRRSCHQPQPQLPPTPDPQLAVLPEAAQAPAAAAAASSVPAGAAHTASKSGGKPPHGTSSASSSGGTQASRGKSLTGAAAEGEDLGNVC